MYHARTQGLESARRTRDNVRDFRKRLKLLRPEIEIEVVEDRQPEKQDPTGAAVDASREQSDVDEEWAQRRLEDGSEWEVFKRYFTPDALLAELGDGEVLHAGTWFVVVRSPRP